MAYNFNKYCTEKLVSNIYMYYIIEYFQGHSLYIISRRGINFFFIRDIFNKDIKCSQIFMNSITCSSTSIYYTYYLYSMMDITEYSLGFVITICVF